MAANGVQWIKCCQHRALFFKTFALSYQAVDVLDSFDPVVVLLNVAPVGAEDKIGGILAVLWPLWRICDYYSLAQASATTKEHSLP
jgi:hypothetical protein